MLWPCCHRYRMAMACLLCLPSHLLSHGHAAIAIAWPWHAYYACYGICHRCHRICHRICYRMAMACLLCLPWHLPPLPSHLPSHGHAAIAIAWPWHAYYACHRICHRIYYRMAMLPSLLHGHGMPIRLIIRKFLGSYSLGRLVRFNLTCAKKT